jgi:hypothetical protein
VIRSYETASGRLDFCNGDPVNNFDPAGRNIVTDIASAAASTVYQTFASGVQTIQSGFAQAAGVVYGDRQAGNAVANQYFNQAMNNSVSGQVLNNGGSLEQATWAANIMGGTLTAAAAVPAAVAGGEALLGAYASGSFGGTGVVGTSLYVASNAAMNAGLSMAGNAVTQEMATGTINWGQFEASGVLGAAFGSLSGGYGVWVNSINAGASQTAGQLVFSSSGAAYFLGVNDGAIEATDALAAQVMNNAAFQMGLISGLDATLSPWVQFGIESKVDASLERGSSGENSSGGTAKSNCP